MKTEKTSTSLHVTGKNITDRAKPRVRSLSSVICFGVLFAIVIASAFYTGSLASSRNKQLSSAPHSRQPSTVSEKRTDFPSRDKLFKRKWLSPFLLPQPPTPDDVATYAVVTGACTNTPKDSFNLGEDVCVKVSNVSLGNIGPVNLITIGGTDGTVADAVDITTDRKSTRLNSSHIQKSRMPSSA